MTGYMQALPLCRPAGRVAPWRRHCRCTANHGSAVSRIA